MSNIYDYQKLSTYIGGIVDRKTKALSLGITTSIGYLRSFTLDAQNAAATATVQANNALNSASDAETSENNTTLLYHYFKSTYLGLKASDPTSSDLGDVVVHGAFYIRSSDYRLRVSSVVAGSLSWHDAMVAADPDTLRAAGQGIFLSRIDTAQQDVNSVVDFKDHIYVPRIVSWNTRQAASAVDVGEFVSVETDRATNAEGELAQDIVDLRDYTDGRHNELSTAVTGEYNRALAAEEALEQDITDLRDYTDGRHNELSDAVTLEYNRAVAIEEYLGEQITNVQNYAQTGIEGEKTRAEGVEATLDVAIKAVSDDVENIYGEIGDLDDRIFNEYTRANDRETSIYNYISDFKNMFSSGSNSYGYWEKRPGVIEMWGYANAPANSEVIVTVDFPYELDATTYNLNVTGVITNGSIYRDLYPQIVKTALRAKDFTIQYQTSDSSSASILGFMWRIIHRGTGVLRNAPATYTPIINSPEFG